MYLVIHVLEPCPRMVATDTRPDCGPPMHAFLREIKVTYLVFTGTSSCVWRSLLDHTLTSIAIYAVRLNRGSVELSKSVTVDIMATLVLTDLVVLSHDTAAHAKDAICIKMRNKPTISLLLIFCHVIGVHNPPVFSPFVALTCSIIGSRANDTQLYSVLCAYVS